MRSSEVKSDITIWKAWYDFLSMFNSNICLDVAILQDKAHLSQNLKFKILKLFKIDLKLLNWFKKWKGFVSTAFIWQSKQSGRRSAKKWETIFLFYVFV